MVRLFAVVLVVIGLAALYGCETVNRGAEKVGEGAGRVMSVPNSASEGAATGLQGRPASNPYNR